MFTQQFLQEIEQAFEEQLKRLGERKVQIVRLLEKCSDQEAEALKCLYASMPVSDAIDYSPELFLSYAKHGVFLWEKGPFAGKIPEKLFAGYVLHHRVNNEDLTDSRPFFYGQLKDDVEEIDMKEAILAVNYWCASQATYRTTDGRTASPACVYRSAYGRCGEESTFAVTALRSVGIPARQVYVPLWSHCDDNHAWVEVWCSGEWKFLGACEPEEVLNKGWFTNASSRAMMVHSRWFLPGDPEEDIVGRAGMSQVLNQLKRYANPAKLEVTVLKEDHTPAAGEEIRFYVMNYSHLGEIASVCTDENGKQILETGLGTIFLSVSGKEGYGEAFVDTREQKNCVIMLKKENLCSSEKGWEGLLIHAPKDAPINRCAQTEEEIARGRKKLAAVTLQRQEKENGFYDPELAESVTEAFSEKDRERCCEIMQMARGNQKEIAEFLSRTSDGKWPENWKLDILNSLREKDYLDITADILEEHCKETAEYESTYPDDILIPYILCPRVGNEMIRPFRGFIRSWLGQEKRQELQNNPERVWKLVEDTLTENPDLEYENLITSAKGALTSGYGSRLTKKVISVQILRTIGVPARLNPADEIPEFWKDGHFVPLEQSGIKEAERTAAIVVHRQENKSWTYFQNWTISRFEQDGYRVQMLGAEEGEEIYGTIPLFPGKYRILTSNRLPNGNIFARKLAFELKDGESRDIWLEQTEASPEDLLEDNDITDFTLRKEDGTRCKISDLVKENRGLFIWLEESKEPTEHILNEIYQRQEAFGQLPANIYFVIRDLKVKEDPTLKRTLKGVSGVEFLLDDFDADMSVLARRMYLEPGKLPLIVIIDQSMKGIYGMAGYNVGTADMILKILNMYK